MGRPHQTAKLVKSGFSPHQIAELLGISLESVLGYLNRAVGEGCLRRSDIYFAVPPQVRQGPDLAKYSDARAAFGDLYEDIRAIEIHIHRMVRLVLEQDLGNEESGWWREGVPESVRVKCQERREKDVDVPCEPYCYTDLLDLGKIIEANWNSFQVALPACYASNRKALLDDLRRLNRIRNKVMHPVRGVAPDEADFDFVHGLERELVDGSNGA